MWVLIRVFGFAAPVPLKAACPPLAVEAGGFQRRAGFTLQDVSNHSAVAHRLRSAAGCAIQHTASIFRPIRADSVDFQR